MGKVRVFYVISCMNSGSVCLQYFPVDQAPIEGYTFYPLAGGNTHHPPSDRASGQHAVKHQHEILQCGRSQRRVQYGRVCIYLFIQYIPFRTLFHFFFLYLCHSHVILQAAVTVPRTSMMSFSYLFCGLPLLFSQPLFT